MLAMRWHIVLAWAAGGTTHWDGRCISRGSLLPEQDGFSLLQCWCRKARRGAGC